MHRPRQNGRHLASARSISEHPGTMVAVAGVQMGSLTVTPECFEALVPLRSSIGNSAPATFSRFPLGQPSSAGVGSCLGPGEDARLVVYQPKATAQCVRRHEPHVAINQVSNGKRFAVCVGRGGPSSTVHLSQSPFRSGATATVDTPHVGRGVSVLSKQTGARD